MSSEPIIVTKNAAQKVFELILEDGNPDLKLRVYVTGGGCSGLQYGFAFEQTTNDDDFVILGTVDDQHHIEVIVDHLSMDYLRGAEIDYAQDFQGERFIIRNPNAKTTCGCGSSFDA